MTLLISLLCIISSLLLFRNKPLIKNKIARYFLALLIIIIGLGEIVEAAGKAYKNQVISKHLNK